MDTPHIILVIVSIIIGFGWEFKDSIKRNLPSCSRSAQTGYVARTNYVAHDDDDEFQTSAPMFNVDGTMMMGDFDPNCNMYGCSTFD